MMRAHLAPFLSPEYDSSGLLPYELFTTLGEMNGSFSKRNITTLSLLYAKLTISLFSVLYY